MSKNSDMLKDVIGCPVEVLHKVKGDAKESTNLFNCKLTSGK